MILGGRPSLQQQAARSHRAPDPTDTTCPVCHARVHKPCRGVDFLTLPTVHGERIAGTPLFDRLAARL